MNARIPPPALLGNVNVPEPLKAVPFLPYYTELRAGHSGKLDKKPFVHSNRFAPTGPNHQNARLPFDEAYQLRQAGASAGVGIIFDSSHDLVGIDLDNCVDGNGQWSQYAIDAYNWLGRPAWETSISGRGLHFYGRADKSRCPDTTDWVDGSGQHVEIFTKSKFIALSDAFTAQLAGGTFNGPLPDLTDHLIQWAASGGRGVSTGGGKRLPLGHADLAAPSFEWATRTLFDIDPNELTYDEWVTATAAFKAAAWPHKGEDATRATWEVWCAQYTTGRGNDLSQNAAKWRSINEAEAGFNYLLRKSGLRREYQESRALQTFASHPIPAIQTVVSVPQPLDGYVEIISTATGDSGKNTLMETVKLLHGNLPVAFDEFTQTVQATHPLAWDKYSNYPRQWTELDTIHCQLSVQACFVKPGKDTVHDAVAIIANRHKFHPVRDYLNSLTWDGTERLPQLASAYFGASDTPYTRIVGTKFMIGAVARIVLPGCKMDNVVILEGKQGTGKSSAIATLAGARWFTDELPDLHTKDAAIQLHGKWMIEVGELSALKRSDVETIKKFMSRSTDTFRAPYERTTEDHPRQSVFIATTNDERYLKDQTGNRRFWPLACGLINVKAIERDRDQLWAEAVARHRAGECWWLNDSEAQLANIEQEDRREIDAWEERVAAHVATLAGLPTTMASVCTILGIDFERQNSSVTKRIAYCLARAGYVRKRSSPGSDGKRTWHYVLGGQG